MPDPRSSWETPSTCRARCTTSWLARISPGPALEQSRAARFSAPPRNPPVDRHGLPGVDADADRERQRRIADGLFDESSLEIDGGADRTACRREGRQGLIAAELDQRPARASSTTSCASDANRVERAAAASSPRVCVNVVYPRMSAIRKIRSSFPSVSEDGGSCRRSGQGAGPARGSVRAAPAGTCPDRCPVGRRTDPAPVDMRRGHRPADPIGTAPASGAPRVAHEVVPSSVSDSSSPTSDAWRPNRSSSADPVLDRRPAILLEADDLTLQGPLVLEIGERRPPPQAGGLAETERRPRPRRSPTRDEPP